MSMCIGNMKIDSSPRPHRRLNQSAAAQSSFSRGSKKLLDTIFVGIDRDAELIRDKLVEDQRKLDVVSIVGMGGIGKTALATKVYNDGYVKHYFLVRVWVTVSQTYDKRGVLIQILESIRSQLGIEKASNSLLREMVHKQLMGRRYLIVIDDIWHTETWHELKLFFPHDNNGSRILLTSRLTEVAKHANSYGLIHQLGYLNKEKGWELLCEKVFHGNECPKWSIKLGMQIVKNCQGLPLAIVVIAGVLAKEAYSEEFWEEIAHRTSLYIVGDENGCMETLGLSYNHLPLHLRECFLYLGGFPEDFKFEVKRLMWLWVAEGFIQHDGNRSLEDIAEGYLVDLVDRNLVIVAGRRKSNGGLKACKLHDLVRELCLKKAKEEGFKLQFSAAITQPYKPLRMLIYEDIDILPAQNLRSIVFFSYFRSLGDAIANGFRSFELLRVLDLQKCKLDDFPEGVELLVHLRYLTIQTDLLVLPVSICNFWSLQTLIVYVMYDGCIVLPREICNLVNLRHLFTCPPYGGTCSFPRSIGKPMNLQTISKVSLQDGVDDFQKYFPYIKELHCIIHTEKQKDFKSLSYLEKLKLEYFPISFFITSVKCFKFPVSLKSLTLSKCSLAWSEMSFIQSLPNLQVLKLHYNAFVGSCWNTDEQVFPHLKVLKLSILDIKQWEAYNRSFPCLRQLEIFYCSSLEEIPLEVGDIPTLELIKIRRCRPCVCESVRRIEEEQRDLGNYDLKIYIQEEW
ncbi:putative P-loop containing nucleoside triphosphate hydrolase [Helianthus anomalus]